MGEIFLTAGYWAPEQTVKPFQVILTNCISENPVAGLHLI